MEMRAEVSKLMFEDLTTKERVEFCEWLHREHEDYLQYAALGKQERKMWNHTYLNITEGLGLDFGKKMSGEK